MLTPSDTPLFRKEAIDATNVRLGSAIRPVSLTIAALTVFLLTILATAGAFLSVAQYARKETVAGVIEPSDGAARLVAPKPGVVTSVRVSEGERVARGAPIFVINQDVVTDTGASLSALLTQATEAQASALQEQINARRLSSSDQKRELIAKREGLLVHQSKLDSDIALQVARVGLQQKSLNIFEKLNEHKIVSDLQYRDREDSVMQARQSLSAIEKDRDDTASEIAQIDAELTRVASDLAETEAQLNVSRAEVREREATNQVSKEIILTAPKTGRVVAIQVKPGAAVGNAAALAIILPEGSKLNAELWAPSRAAGFIRTGDRVRLMLDPFPYEKFGIVFGTVAAIASAPTPPAELTVPIETKESLYRIDVELDRQYIEGYGKSWHFIPGMRLSADLILEKRTLLECLLDPVFASMRRNLN